MTDLICESMLLGVIGGLLGVLYNYSLGSGAIFGSIGQLLSKWSDNGGWLGWISNPLGACIYCSTTWITIFILILYWYSWDCLPDIPCIIICSLAALGVQHLIVRLCCLLESKAEEE